MASGFSRLQRERLRYSPPLPSVLAGPRRLEDGGALEATHDADRIAALFPKTYEIPRVKFVPAEPGAVEARPLKIGVVLSGGQAPGGHNVIMGIFDYIKRVHAESVLIGFLNGPAGLFGGKFKEITAEVMDRYRNMGGFDIIGSGRDKIETPEQFAGSKLHCERLGLDGVVIIGGDDSNTNAALLAEYFAAEGCRTRVVGAPKTIDGDLKNEFIPISFGFDTACKTYSELIGNVCLDAVSSTKYYHFIRLMGRAASNITLECALQTQPTVAIIAEEVAARQQNLASVTEEIVRVIVERSRAGKDYGVVLLPEGLIEFIPEMNALLAEINDLLASGTTAELDTIQAALSANNAALFAYLPLSIKRQLLADRDPHGNVQVSKIETEKLLCETIQHELDRMRARGAYAGSFSSQFHFFGYEGRCGLPSEFDTAYCFALGYNAGALVHQGLTGLMSCVSNLGEAVEDWHCGGVPLTMMMNIERRRGKDKPVIRKALVDLAGLPFRTFALHRRKWATQDCFRSPGPIQFHGLEDAADEDHRGGGGGGSGGEVGGGGAGGATHAAVTGRKTRVDPLCETLRLELEDASEKARAGHAHGPGHAHGGAPGSAAEYAAFLEGILASDALSLKQVEAILMYRLKHLIPDQDHEAALRSLGWSLEDLHTAEIEAYTKAAGGGGGGGSGGASGGAGAAAADDEDEMAKKRRRHDS